jgi:hypothetical protein
VRQISIHSNRYQLSVNFQEMPPHNHQSHQHLSRITYDLLSCRLQPIRLLMANPLTTIPCSLARPQLLLQFPRISGSPAANPSPPSVRQGEHSDSRHSAAALAAFPAPEQTLGKVFAWKLPSAPRPVPATLSAQAFPRVLALLPTTPPLPTAAPAQTRLPIALAPAKRTPLVRINTAHHQPPQFPTQPEQAYSKSAPSSIPTTPI